jgi:FtsZ-interacting cell division protein ZipA
MDTWIWIVVAVAVVALVVVAVLAWQAARRKRLQDTFGPVYEREVADASSRREAEAELEDRRKRREQLDIRPLSTDAAERYANSWEGVQTQFVDDPVGATRDADRLVAQVMAERGYPMEDFESRADLISVDHPTVVENYRSAHEAYVAYDRGDASTEDLRQAMVHYRSLFSELLETDERADTYEEVR